MSLPNKLFSNCLVLFFHLFMVIGVAEHGTNVPCFAKHMWHSGDSNDSSVPLFSLCTQEAQ